MALDSTLLGHLRDLYLHSEQWSCPLSSCFLTQDEWRELIHYFPSNRFLLSGGYPSAERKMAIFLPEPLKEGEDFDVQPFLLCFHIEASGKKFGEKLEHRQVLGALLGQGIERDALGDVLVEGAEAYSFCLPSLQEEIASLQEVGPYKIQVKFVPLSSMNFSPRIEIKQPLRWHHQRDVLLLPRPSSRSYRREQNLFGRDGVASKRHGSRRGDYSNFPRKGKRHLL